MKAGGPGVAAVIGWQTLLADLSLILFMVTAAAMSASPRPGRPEPAGAAPAPPNSPAIPALGEPLAVWRAGGSQSLGQWLAAQQADGRQQLTITVHYPSGAPARALAAAQALVGQAGARGQSARVIVTPAASAAGDEMLASLAYDEAPDAGTAQGLLDRSGISSARTPP